MDGFFGIGLAELFMIAVIALIVLGPERLPGTLREVAKVLRQLRKISGEFTSQFSEELKALDDLNPRKLLNEMTDPNKPDPDEKAKANKTTPAAKTTATTKPATPAKPATTKTTPTSTTPASTTAATQTIAASSTATNSTANTASAPSAGATDKNSTDKNSTGESKKAVEQTQNSIASPALLAEKTAESSNGAHLEPVTNVASVPAIEPNITPQVPDQVAMNGHLEEEKVL